MPQLAPIATAVTGAAAAAASAAGGAGLLSAGIGVYQGIKQQGAAKKAQKKAKEAKAAERAFMEKQAGEYYDLSEKQMELQAQGANIRTLASLIGSRREATPAPRIFTLPPAKEYSPFQQINMAIDKLFRG